MKSKKSKSPFPAGRVSAPVRGSLQARKPKLAREWHPKRNLPLTPRDVTVFSNRKVWWQCGKGHAWQAVISNRSLGTDCPYCSGHVAHKDNCLRTVNPALAAEWHPTRNAPLTPKDVTAHTHKKVWWLCRNGHIWQALISNRLQGSECPTCSGRRVSKENSLRTLSPKLAVEWHPSRNRPLTPAHVTAWSSRPVWWLCPVGHKWRASVASRSEGKQCTRCNDGRRRGPAGRNSKFKVKYSK